MDRDDHLPQTSIETLERSGEREPSPFSSKKVIHESDTPHNKSNQPTESKNTSVNLEIVSSTNHT